MLGNKDFKKFNKELCMIICGKYYKICKYKIGIVCVTTGNAKIKSILLKEAKELSKCDEKSTP